MMNSPYDLHSWSKQYREERLSKARLWHLAKGSVIRSSSAYAMLLTLVVISILLCASACTQGSDAPDSTPSAGSGNSTSKTTDTVAPSSPSSDKDKVDKDQAGNNDNRDTDSADTNSAAANQYTASPSATASASSPSRVSSSASESASGSARSAPALDVNYEGVRNTVDMSPSTSIECYSFHSDGTVELRHNGASTPDDSGTYRGDATGGQIAWDSGRTSTVVVESETLLINDLKVTQVPTCTPAPSSATSSTSASASASPAGDYAGTTSSTGMECYSFADGNVELRLHGAYAPSDTGVYRGHATGGTITWDSGGSSAVTEEGGSLRIDGLEVDPIESCLVPTLR
jgi:hypothetical protein